MYLNVNMEGRMVNDPEFKSGKNGREFVTFRMVVNQYAGGEENATFISCTGGEDIASRMKKVTLKKGRLLHLSGELAEHHYTNRDGIDRTSLDLSIHNWHFVGPREKSDEAKAVPDTSAKQNSNGTLHDAVNVSSEDDLPL